MSGYATASSHAKEALNEASSHDEALNEASEISAPARLKVSFSPEEAEQCDLTPEQLGQIYAMSVRQTETGLKVDVNVMIMMMTLFQGAHASNASDLVVANSVAFYNYVFTVLLVLSFIGLYRLFIMLLDFCRFSTKEYEGMKKFLKGEYKGGKKFAQREFKSLRQSVRLYMTITAVFSGISVLLNFIGLFKSHTISLPEMKPQGFRKDANRAGMFVSGLISLAIILLAPLMGAKKVLKYLEPIISVLRQIPYATWVVSFARKCWRGDWSFDDLPQTHGEWQEQMGEMDDAEEMEDALDEVRSATEKMEKQVNKGKNPKPENLAKATDSIPKSPLRTRTQEDLYATAKRQGFIIDIQEVDENDDVELYHVYHGPLLRTHSLVDGDSLMAFLQHTLKEDQLDKKIRMTGFVYESFAALHRCFTGLEPDEEVLIWGSSGMNKANPIDESDSEIENINVEEVLDETPLTMDGLVKTQSIIDEINEHALNDFFDEHQDDSTGKVLRKRPVKKADDPERTVLPPKFGDGGNLDQQVKERMGTDDYADIQQKIDKGKGSKELKPQHFEGYERMTWSNWWEVYFSEYAAIFRGLWDDEPEDDTTIKLYSWKTEKGKKTFPTHVTHKETWFGWFWRELCQLPYDVFYAMVPLKGEQDTNTVITAATWTYAKDGKRVPGMRDPIVQKVPQGQLLAILLAWWRTQGKRFVKFMLFIVVLTSAMKMISSKNISTTDLTEIPISTQGKNRGKKRGNAQRKRNGKRKFIVQSGGADVDDQYDHFEEPNDHSDDERMDRNDEEYGYAPVGRKQADKLTQRAYVAAQKGFEGMRRERKETRKNLKGQSTTIVIPQKEGEAQVRNKIRKSKQPLQAKASDILTFCTAAKKALNVNLKPQAFNPYQLAAGVFKFYQIIDGKAQYCCTGTHIGNKMWVVLHCMNEDISAKYRAINHCHTFEFEGKEMMVFGDQLACFPVSGYASPFKGSSMKVLEDAAIVTVYGYGNGQNDHPDAVTGFASPEGWCNARTRDGDCTSPVLNSDGQVVGFWTHGDGKSFGRFEKVTPEMIEFAKNGSQTMHIGLDFQLRPHSR